MAYCYLAGRRLVLALTLLLFGSLSQAQSRPHMVFSCWVPPSVPLFRTLDELFSETFDSLGYDFTMHYRPNQRSLMEANAGISDGECARTLEYEQEHPDGGLIRIDAILAQTSMEVWASRADLTINSVQDLVRTSWRIGYVRGHVVVADLMERHPLHRLVSVTSTEQGLKMVSAGRLDLFIGTSVSTRQEIRTMRLTRPVHSVGHIQKILGYAYLNKKHRALLPELEQALRERIPAEGWAFE